MLIFALTPAMGNHKAEWYTASSDFNVETLAFYRNNRKQWFNNSLFLFLQRIGKNVYFYAENQVLFSIYQKMCA